MVVLYSNHCPLCNRLKEVLDKAEIIYGEVNDIATMEALGIDRLPMLRVDTESGPEMLKYAAALKWVEQRGKDGQG
jgi:predicted DCC family thiol-disulfide oxidoreductase YuxK